MRRGWVRSNVKKCSIFPQISNIHAYITFHLEKGGSGIGGSFFGVITDSMRVTKINIYKVYLYTS